MIFLALLYLCFFSGSSNTLALPTYSRSPEILPQRHLQSICIREEDVFDTRSIYNILASCLSTIFACTWTAVHPNIPAPGDSRWIVLGRRMAIMGCILLAPETVIFWAGRQHFAAHNFAKKHEKNHPGWTRTHSFFLIMGGFTLHKGGKPVRVLEAKDLEELSEAGKIEWPKVTEDEIADRNKGDYLSKTIVLLQTTWFIIQCIARGAYGLTVTELEVVTLAFSALTGVIYYLWWDKPLDVRCSIPVHFLDHRVGEIEDDFKEGIGSKIISLPEVLDQEIRGDEKIIDLNSLPSTPDTSTPHPTNTGSHIIPLPEVSDESMPGDADIHPNLLPPTSVQDDRSFLDLAFIRMQRLRAILFEHGYTVIVSPWKHFVVAAGDMFDCNTLGDQILRVPTFYSPPNKPRDLRVVGAIAVCTGTAFGVIHWIMVGSFHFVTLQELPAWYISAILVSLMPIILSFSVLMLVGTTSGLKVKAAARVEISDYHFLLVSLSFASICIYVIARRIILLVLSFMAFRSLPPSAYIQLTVACILYCTTKFTAQCLM